MGNEDEAESILSSTIKPTVSGRLHVKKVHSKT